MNPPAFSIILPTLGNTAHLRRALASVRSQTLAAWECLVALDQPSAAPSVRSLIDSFHDPRLHLIVHSQNLGVSAARNSAARTARAPLLAFLDDDDFWTPDKLQCHIDAHQAHPSAALVYSDVIIWWQENTLPPRRLSALPAPPQLPAFPALIPDKLGIATPSSTTVRRDACLESGGFDEALSYDEDTDFYLRLGRHAPFVHIAAPLAFYTHSLHGSLSTRSRSGEQTEALLQKHSLPPSSHPRYRRTAASSKTKSLIGTLHLRGRRDAWREFTAFLRDFHFRHPLLLAKHFLICLLPFSFYRFWYARHCHPHDSLQLRQTLARLPTP